MPTATPSSVQLIQKIAEGLAAFSTDIDALGDAYEYLIGQFAAGSGKKAGGSFVYTPQQISDILSAIVTLDSQSPEEGPKQRLDSVLDFACGSGSLLLNVRKRVAGASSSKGSKREQDAPEKVAGASSSNRLKKREQDAPAPFGTMAKFLARRRNITTYNLARMNMLLHGVKDTEF